MRARHVKARGAPRRPVARCGATVPSLLLLLGPVQLQAARQAPSEPVTKTGSVARTGPALTAHRAAMTVQADTTEPLIMIRVDERVELMGVLFRLAGRREYDMTQVSSWSEAIDSHFAPHADHPAVGMAKRLAGRHRIGFFIPMNLAVHVTPPPALEERVDFESSTSLHGRWAASPDSTRAFLELARAFAVDADFARFLSDNHGIVDTTETRLRRLVDDLIDLAWFPRFWGAGPTSDFVLVPGLLNGRASYGADFVGAEGRQELYAITGVTTAGPGGFPTFDPSFATTVVHEFNHSFANPLVEQYRAQLEEISEPLYESVVEAMQAQAYGSWESMMYESLVRAAVVRYLASVTGEAAAEEEARAQADEGFEWTPALADLLAEYEAGRDAYPTMESFMPRVVEFFRELAQALTDHP